MALGDLSVSYTLIITSPCTGVSNKATYTLSALSLVTNSREVKVSPLSVEYKISKLSPSLEEVYQQLQNKDI